MDLVDVPARSELPDGRDDVLAPAVRPRHLGPRSDAEENPGMVVATGDVDGLAERAGAAEDSRHALVVHRRVVRMQLQVHAGCLGDRQDSVHEVAIVRPHRSVVVRAVVGVGQCLRIGIAEEPCLGAARHRRAGLIGTAGVPSVCRIADAESSEVTDERA